jgi:hypothetical protein
MTEISDTPRATSSRPERSGPDGIPDEEQASWELAGQR